MVPKSADEAARLRKILSRNYLFSELATGQLDNVVEVQATLCPGELRQGRPGVLGDGEGEWASWARSAPP